MSVSEVLRLAEQFERIHLEEMDQVQLMNRTDTKFSFTLDDLLHFLPELQKDYKILSVDDQLLSDYESQYFDDPLLTSYHDHHREKINRFKIRYRKYVHSDITFLEVKHKVNGRTLKSRIQVANIREKMTEEEEAFVRGLGVKGSQFSPTLFNRFKRITLVSKSMEERLTLDVDIVFQWEGKEQPLEQIVIAELKQNKVSMKSPFYRLMKKHHIRPFRLSKYCLGIIKIYGKDSIKYNRFKKKLLQINKLQNAA